MNKFVFVVVVISAVACGKSKGGDTGGSAAGSGGAGGAAAGGPSCADAGAQYAKLSAEGFGNPLAKMKPTPDQVKVVAGKLEAHCTSANWSAADKTCVMNAKDNMAIAKDCFKEPRGFGLQVSQVLFDTVNELKAAAPAAGSDGSAAPAAGSDGSAAAGSGSAAAGSAAAGSGSAKP